MKEGGNEKSGFEVRAIYIFYYSIILRFPHSIIHSTYHSIIDSSHLPLAALHASNTSDGCQERRGA